MFWYIRSLKNYAKFSGRASRQEYWYFVLVYAVFWLVAAGLDRIIGSGSVLTTLYSLFFVVPSSSLAFRRLHDSGRSGKLLILLYVSLLAPVASVLYAPITGSELNFYVVGAAFVPYVLLLLYLIFALTRPSDKEENQYGKLERI